MLILLCSCWPVSFGRVNGKRKLSAVRRLKNVGKVWKDGHMIHKITMNMESPRPDKEEQTQKLENEAGKLQH